MADRRRDRYSWAPAFDERADHSWQELNDALDDLREHMHTGTPLTEPVRGPHHEEQG